MRSPVSSKHELSCGSCPSDEAAHDDVAVHADVAVAATSSGAWTSRRVDITILS
jgi:hypothetical protein